MGSLRCITYNAQCSSWLSRLQRILVVFSYVQFIGLQGTGISARKFAQPDETYRTERVQHSDIIHRHAATTEFSNKCTGVCVATDPRAFHRCHRAQIFSPRGNLQGRGGPVRYFKPQASHQYIAQALSAIGPLKREVTEYSTGHLVAKLLHLYRLLLMNTFMGEASLTCNGWHGEESRIDFIAMRVSDLPGVTCCQVLRQARYSLQPSRCSASPDHSPVMVHADTTLSFVSSSAITRWNWDKLGSSRLYQRDPADLRMKLQRWATDDKVPWQDGIRAAARNFIGPAQEHVYKYPPSEATTQARALRDDAIRANREFYLARVSRPTDFAAVLQAWLLIAKYQRADKILGTCRRHDRENWRHYWNQELISACEKGDMRTANQLIYWIARTGATKGKESFWRTPTYKQKLPAASSSTALARPSRDAREQQYLSLVGKNLRNVEARLRALEGEVRHSIALPSSDEIAAAMVHSGTEHQSAVKAPGHGRGRPRVFAFSALTRTLIVRSDLSPELRALLEQFMGKYDSPRKVARLVPHCIAKPQRNGKFITITIHVRTALEPLLEAIFDYFEKHGGEEVVPFDGPAPRGPLIRDMQAKMEKSYLQSLD